MHVSDSICIMLHVIEKNMHFAYRLQLALIDGTVHSLWSSMSSIEDLTLVCQHTVIVKGPVVLSGGSTSPIVSTSVFCVLLIRQEDLQSSHCASMWSLWKGGSSPAALALLFKSVSQKVTVYLALYSIALNTYITILIYNSTILQDIK